MKNTYISGVSVVGDCDISLDKFVPNGAVRVARSFIAVLATDPARSIPPRVRIHQLPDWRPTQLFGRDRASELAFIDAQGYPKNEPHSAPGKLVLVVGDDAEWDVTQGQSCMAGAGSVEWDPARNCLRVVSSIVGLPPIYVCRMPGAIAVTSELHLLRAIEGAQFSVNPQAVEELFSVGYPLEGRTLFNEIAVMPGGHCLQVSAPGSAEVTEHWEPPEPSPDLDRSISIDTQVAAFRKAVRKLELSNSVLSLTGGLDTRAILSVLLETGAKLPACTLTGGKTLCLDARQARVLCTEYGFPHTIVSLGEQFLGDLPRYVVEASRLSGGLASLGQAHEVYFYEQIRGLGSKRLSGILGNQVGRRGVEGTYQRNGSFSVLAQSCRRAEGNRESRHWLSEVAQTPNHTLHRTLIQREALYSSIGNYSIGHHFMMQQHPYANRALIESALKFSSTTDSNESFSPNRARLRDLRHRLLGQPLAQSFQKQVVAAAGGGVSTYPMNWGARPDGGISLQGLAWGGLALLDRVSSRWCSPTGLMQESLGVLGIAGVEEIRPWRAWMDGVLRDFVNDCLRSRSVTESELFNAAALGSLLDEHYDGVRPHYGTILAALDLALAQQLFSRSSMNHGYVAE